MEILIQSPGERDVGILPETIVVGIENLMTSDVILSGNHRTIIADLCNRLGVELLDEPCSVTFDDECIECGHALEEAYGPCDEVGCSNNPQTYPRGR